MSFGMELIGGIMIAKTRGNLAAPQGFAVMPSAAPAEQSLTKP
jgi:hypothetical protein